MQRHRRFLSNPSSAIVEISSVAHEDLVEKHDDSDIASLGYPGGGATVFTCGPGQEKFEPKKANLDEDMNFVAPGLTAQLLDLQSRVDDIYSRSNLDRKSMDHSRCLGE